LKTFIPKISLIRHQAGASIQPVANNQSEFLWLGKLKWPSFSSAFANVVYGVSHTDYNFVQKVIHRSPVGS